MLKFQWTDHSTDIPQPLVRYKLLSVLYQLVNPQHYILPTTKSPIQRYISSFWAQPNRNSDFFCLWWKWRNKLGITCISWPVMILGDHSHDQNLTTEKKTRHLPKNYRYFGKKTRCIYLFLVNWRKSSTVDNIRRVNCIGCVNVDDSEEKTVQNVFNPKGLSGL